MCECKRLYPSRENCKFARETTAFAHFHKLTIRQRQTHKHTRTTSALTHFTVEENRHLWFEQEAVLTQDKNVVVCFLCAPTRPKVLKKNRGPEISTVSKRALLLTWWGTLCITQLHTCVCVCACVLRTCPRGGLCDLKSRALDGVESVALEG